MSDPYSGRRRRGGYQVAGGERQKRIEANARRDWDRHPEIRSEHGGNFERYMRSIHHNITYG